MVETTLTLEERVMVNDLRKMVKDELTPSYDTDFNLLRWLQGHNYDTKVVVPKLRYHLRFRKSCWNLDEMSKRPRDHPIQSHWPYGITSMSEKIENTIINIEQAGPNDYWGMLQTHSVTEVMKSRIQDLEVMLMEVMKLEKATGKQASIIYVLDLNSLNFDKRLFSLVTGPLKTLTQFMSDHYVELFKYFVIVNAPSFMYNLWRLIRPLLPERTKGKVRILGGDWREQILEYSQPSALPDFWNIDGNSTFTAKILPSVKFDEKLYYREDYILGDTCQQVTVAAGKIEYVTIVAKLGATLKWTIHANGEFGFGVFCTDDENEEDETKMDMVYPQITLMSGPTVVPLKDSVFCKKSGIYKFWLSNRHAWWHTLKVQYDISA
uniref:CRAL-TRIO domain-containing protein n=1 Tax=Plectus sambesii TaxID=2011161 RepID=A0A914W2A7_9BILA